MDWGMPLFEAVGADLQFAAIWDAGDPQAGVIAKARTSRKKKEGRP
jgi:hypothetical protein